MTGESIEVRPPGGDDEALSFFRIAAQSLLVPVAKAPAWLEREGREATRVALLGGEVVGGLAVQPMGQWFGGRSVGCGVVRAVGVAPEHRGLGVAERLMKAALLEMRENGMPLSMLFPATQVLYRRVGYEQAGQYVEQSVSLADFPSRGPDLPVTRVPLDDGRLRALYDERARRSSGFLDRSDWLWKRTLDPFHASLELAAYLVGPPEAPEGYLVTHVERSDDDLKGHLTVRDRALLTARAVERARSFLAHHRSVIDRVWLTGPLNEPLLAGLPNQSAEVGRAYQWMLRLTDPRAALEARGYPKGVSLEAHLLVIDDALEPAEQRLVLTVEGGGARVVPGGSGSIKIDVRGLAAMYSGHLSPEAAAEMGYLEGEGDVLRAAFAGPAPAVHEWV